jgi:hypothetical protein
VLQAHLQLSVTHNDLQRMDRWINFTAALPNLDHRGDKDLIIRNHFTEILKIPRIFIKMNNPSIG